jgi:hypothetical protein
MKIRVRLTERWVGEVACPIPVVTLQARDRRGLLLPLRFRIDTGSDLTVIPLALAEREGLPFSRQREGVVRGLVGASRVFRDRIRLVLGGREHEWPCHFVKTDSSGGPRALSWPVLGRAGSLDEYALAIDDGFAIITRLGMFRRWWRERLHFLWKATGRVHSVDEPL